MKYKNLTSFFMDILKPYKMLVVGLLFCGLYYGIHISLSAYTLRTIINTISSFQGDKKHIFDEVIYLLFFYIVLFVLVAINMRFRDFVVLKLVPNVRKRITETMIESLMKHSYNYFQNSFSGSLSSKISDMASGFIYILNKLDNFYAQICVLLGSLISMFFIQPIFSLILFFWSLLFVSITLIYSKKVKNLSYVFSSSCTKLSGIIVDSISNISTLLLFSSRQSELNNIKKTTQKTVEKDQNLNRYIMYMHIMWDVTILFLMGGMIFSLVYMYSKGSVDLGDFTLVIMLSVNLFQGMWWLASELTQFSQEIGKCRQAFSIFETIPESIDVKNAKNITIKKGEVCFKNVSFSYNEGKKVFNNLNITIPSHQKVGLVGFSGAGKTTFVNLILRLFDINKGKILIDNQDISCVKQDSLRKEISMIPQDISLFHKSLKENVLYGNSISSEEDMKKACRKAKIHEFIMGLPKKYKTQVGERGVKLSGGQRQRIAIARAFLKNAPILILDEATASLDTITEKDIQVSLRNLMKDRTVIVIAHRLSTLLEMDRILVFNNGKIIEDGSHDELIKKNGHYCKMWKMQSDRKKI